MNTYKKNKKKISYIQLQILKLFSKKKLNDKTLYYHNLYKDLKKNKQENKT